MTGKATASDGAVCAIGSRLELFVDDWLIDRMDGVSLRMHQPVPREVALEFDRPWEGRSSYDPVYMKEGDRYRMWYRGGPVWDGLRQDHRPEQCTCYAESSDGIHWERPNLGIHETRGIRGFEPTRDNNIVIHGSTARAVCVFRDDNPQAAVAAGMEQVARQGRRPQPSRELHALPEERRGPGPITARRPTAGP